MSQQETNLTENSHVPSIEGIQVYLNSCTSSSTTFFAQSERI
jgi:hypothetical protein